MPKDALTRIVDVGLEGREGILGLAKLHGGLVSFRILPVESCELLELTFATVEAKELFEQEYSELVNIEFQRGQPPRKPQRRTGR
jgi:hypothetical protein